MSGIQGFPSNQKVPLGTGITNNFVSVIPTDPNRFSLDTPRFAFRVNSSTVPRTAGATTGIDSSSGDKLFWVEDTGTPAIVGDFVRFESGLARYLEIPIVNVETNRFLLAINSGLLPSSGDTFYILRSVTQQADSSGNQLVSLVPNPVSFLKNGVTTSVSEDTVTPANSIPLPIAIFDSAGNPVPMSLDFGALASAIRIAAQIGNVTGAADFNAGASGAQTLRVSANITRNGTELSYNAGVTDANTQRVVLPTDMPAIATKAPVNAAGFYDEITNLTTAAQTFTAPANAVGFVIEALSDNTNNVRYKIGAAATTTSGMRLEPGRSENFNNGPAANVSVIAEAGTNQAVTIQWILSAQRFYEVFYIFLNAHQPIDVGWSSPNDITSKW